MIRVKNGYLVLYVFKYWLMCCISSQKLAKLSHKITEMRAKRAKIFGYGGDQWLDGGGLRIFQMGGDRPPWGGQGSNGGGPPPSPPILGNPVMGRHTLKIRNPHYNSIKINSNFENYALVPSYKAKCSKPNLHIFGRFGQYLGTRCIFFKTNFCLKD